VVRPIFTVIRIEYEPLAGLGTAISDNGVTARAIGALSTGGTPIYTVNMPLTGTTQQSGNHRVVLADIPTGYNVVGIDGYVSSVDRVFYYGANQTLVNQSARFNITRNSGAIDADALSSSLKTDFLFYPDVALSAARNGVTATGTAVYSADAGLVTVNVNLGGNTNQPGAYTVRITGDNIPPGVDFDDRSVNIASGAVADRNFRWVFEHNDLDIESLGLDVEIVYEADIEIDETENNGIKADGSARVVAAAQEVNITVNVGGTAEESGNYRVKVLYDGAEYDSRVYPLTGGTTLNTRSFRSSIDISSLGVPFNENLLTLAIDFIPDLTAVPVNNVNARGRISLFDTDGTVQVEVTSDRVGAEGFYRVTLTGSGFEAAQGGVLTQFTRFSQFAEARAVMSYDIKITDMAQFIDTVKMELEFFTSDPYFYIINYRNETISFGESFKITRRIDDDTTETIDVKRSEISFIFNKKS